MACESHTPDLPDELIIEILSWTPVNALMRFRCVSKCWNSLIFNPNLVKLHLQRCSQNTHTLIAFQHWNIPVRERYPCASPCSIRRLIENPASTIDDVDVCHRFNHDDCYVVGVCNGLVSLGHSFDGDELTEHWFRFWNPAMRLMSQESPRLRLTSDKYDYFLRFGFGYDDWSDTYKVLLVVLDIKSQKREVRVHCLGENCWRTVLTCPAFPILRKLSGQFVGGTLNWLALHRSGAYYNWDTVMINELVIFSYDLRKGTFRYLLMPNGLCELPHIGNEPDLNVLSGCLCLSHDQRGTRLVVWLMREFEVQQSWTRLLNISYQHFPIQRWSPYPLRPPKPLCISENGDFMLLTNYAGTEAFVYNLSDNRIDRIEYLEHRFSMFSYDYVQSLVFPYQN